MREIKFRYWNEEHKEMGNFDSMPMFVSDLEVPDDRFKFMQYTGLKDKNGNKIFEGDLIQWSEMQHTSYDYDIEELVTEDYEIEFVNGMFVVKCLEQRFPTHELLTDFDLNEGKLAEIEIIGNIHDNKNILLKDDNEHSHPTDTSASS